MNFIIKSINHFATLCLLAACIIFMSLVTIVDAGGGGGGGPSITHSWSPSTITIGQQSTYYMSSPGAVTCTNGQGVSFNPAGDSRGPFTFGGPARTVTSYMNCCDAGGQCNERTTLLRINAATLPPSLNVSPGSIDFGEVIVSGTPGYADRTITITNSGGGIATGYVAVTGRFSCLGAGCSTGNRFSLNAGQSITKTIRYTPNAYQVDSSNATVVFTEGANQSVSLTGEGIAEVSNPSVQVVRQNAVSQPGVINPIVHDIVLRNAGGGRGTYSVGGLNYPFVCAVNCTGTLSAGEERTIRIQAVGLCPGSPIGCSGTFTDTAVIPTGSADLVVSPFSPPTHNVGVSVTFASPPPPPPPPSTAPIIRTYPALGTGGDFGGVTLDGSKTEPLFIYNDGTANLIGTITHALRSSDRTEMSCIANCSYNIPPGGSHQATLQFAPTSACCKGVDNYQATFDISAQGYPSASREIDFIGRGSVNTFTPGSCSYIDTQLDFGPCPAAPPACNMGTTYGTWQSHSQDLLGGGGCRISYCQCLPAVPQADLQVTSIATADTLAVGQTITIDIGVRNNGTVSTGGVFQGTYEVSYGNPPGSFSGVTTVGPFPAIAGSASNPSSFTYTIPAGISGQQMLVRFCVDQPISQISESDEANNCLQQNLGIVQTVDISLSNVLPGGGASYGPGSASVIFSGDVENVGMSTTANINVQLEVDWDCDGSINLVRTIGNWTGATAGWSDSFTDMISSASSDLRNGNHCYSVFVPRVIGEQNVTNNNSGSIPFTISGLPECSDGVDNDGDGNVDMAGSDTGCSSVNDNTERVYDFSIGAVGFYEGPYDGPLGAFTGNEIRVTIVNSGQEIIASGTNIPIQVDDGAGSISYPFTVPSPLNLGASTLATISVGDYAPGNYTMNIELDAGGTTADEVASNNIAPPMNVVLVLQPPDTLNVDINLDFVRKGTGVEVQPNVISPDFEVECRLIGPGGINETERAGPGNPYNTTYTTGPLTSASTYTLTCETVPVAPATPVVFTPVSKTVEVIPTQQEI